MTGAAASDTAIGHAQAAGSPAGRVKRIHVATASPASTAAAAASGGVPAAASALNSGPLNRMNATTFGTAPSGRAPEDRNGKYSAARTSAATTASRTRTRFQNSGTSTIGSSFAATAITNAIMARMPRPVLSIQAATAIQSAP